MNEYVTWRIIAWSALALWGLGNIVLMSLPLSDVYRLVPSLLLNGLLGAITIVAWSRYNRARESVRVAKVKSQMIIDEQAEQQRANTSYVQTLTVEQPLFATISQDEGQWIRLPEVYRDVFKKGKRLRVHNKAEYGMMKYMEVVDVRLTEDDELLAKLKYLH